MSFAKTVFSDITGTACVIKVSIDRTKGCNQGFFPHGTSCPNKVWPILISTLLKRSVQLASRCFCSHGNTVWFYLASILSHTIYKHFWELLHVIPQYCEKCAQSTFRWEDYDDQDKRSQPRLCCLISWDIIHDHVWVILTPCRVEVFSSGVDGDYVDIAI